MDRMEPAYTIRALRSKWIMFSILADVLLAAGIAFLLAVLTSKFFGLAPWWGILYAVVVLTVLLLVQSVNGFVVGLPALPYLPEDL